MKRVHLSTKRAASRRSNEADPKQKKFGRIVGISIALTVIVLGTISHMQQSRLEFLRTGKLFEDNLRETGAINLSRHLAC